MDKSETTEAVAAIGMMLKAFPSAQSNITADSPKVYLFAVEDYSLEALKRACRAIVRGGVKDLKPDFPPAAPKLAQIVKECEDQLLVERFEADHTFVVEGTDLWKKIELQRGRSLPSTEKVIDGRRLKGWNVTYDEAAKASLLELPPPVSAQELAEINARLAARGIRVGDPEDHEAAA